MDKCQSPYFHPFRFQKDFAATRSHQDARTSNDLEKNLCQILLAINGFAGTAIMTYSGTHQPQVFIPPVALASSTLVFLFGVVSALLAGLTCLEMSRAWATNMEGKTGKRRCRIFKVPMRRVIHELAMVHQYSYRNGGFVLFRVIYPFDAASRELHCTYGNRF